MLGINTKLHPFFSGCKGCQRPFAAAWHTRDNIAAFLRFDDTCTVVFDQVLMNLDYKITEALVNRSHKHIKIRIHKSFRYPFYFLSFF